MTDVQTEVALAADEAGSHATAPVLLLHTQTALGRLAAVANAATDSGRLPFRVEADWADLLGELAQLAYLLADQTGVDLDAAVRRAASRPPGWARSATAEPAAGQDWI